MATPALASEKLIYNQKLSKSSSLLIKKFLNSSPSEFDIAQIDLNDDGLSEFIIRPKTCNAHVAPCQFSIVAETGNDIVSLGVIDAMAVSVDAETTSGVRNIHAFDNPRNDFDYSLYNWEAARSQYMMKE